ncbi:peptidyl-prolyl cis-trans isomerases [Zea mays]|uniref:Peptidyl-prolyl cis-trans isomerases n=1 Tax=Zea mays TaxID=4577 RepID=A0A1D6KB94_MAIZE|nr:peptidyl-prolyl cis-trans isomerases [Zea mays]
MPTFPAFPLTRRPSDARRRGCLVLSLVIFVAVSAVVALAYLSFPSAGRTSPLAVRTEADCCRGMEGLELWGPAVKWGSDHRLPSAVACCAACKAMCPHPKNGACRCDSWVFCGDERKCKDRLGEQKPTICISIHLFLFCGGGCIDVPAKPRYLYLIPASLEII